jgi:hypothetical protein
VILEARLQPNMMLLHAGCTLNGCCETDDSKHGGVNQAEGRLGCCKHFQFLHMGPSSPLSHVPQDVKVGWGEIEMHCSKSAGLRSALLRLQYHNTMQICGLHHRFGTGRVSVAGQLGGAEQEPRD